MLKKVTSVFFILLYIQSAQSMEMQGREICCVNEYENWKFLLQTLDKPQERNTLVVLDMKEIFSDHSNDTLVNEKSIRVLKKIREIGNSYFYFDSSFDSGCRTSIEAHSADRHRQFNIVGLSSYLASSSPFQINETLFIDNKNAFCVDSEYSIVYTLNNGIKTNIGLILQHLIEKNFLKKPNKLIFIGKFWGNATNLEYRCANLEINMAAMYHTRYQANIRTQLTSSPMINILNRSSIIRCDAWESIENVLLRNLNNSKPQEKIVVGFDIDDVLLEKRGSLLNWKIPEILNKRLVGKNVPRFCLTACSSVFWRERRKQFDRAGISSFFKASNTFLRQWNPSGDNKNPFYVDADYAIAYSVRSSSKTTIDKGVAFVGLLEKGFLERPDKLIFTDDLLENLIEIQQRCLLEKIDFIGIWYPAQ
jgi:hypothetical protein